jgi:hypothetical protein
MNHERRSASTRRHDRLGRPASAVRAAPAKRLHNSKLEATNVSIHTLNHPDTTCKMCCAFLQPLVHSLSVAIQSP